MYSLIFGGSVWLMHKSGEWVIGSLMRLSKALGVREFVVGFFVMAAASSLPNLFVGLTSASQGIPELSLGDVFGNNFVAMTLAVIVAIIFAPKKEIETGGQTVQSTAVFTMCAAILPVLFIFDGTLSRADGIVLIGFFFMYVIWLVKKQNLFSKVYASVSGPSLSPVNKLKANMKDTLLVVAGLGMLVLGSIGIVYSASFLADRVGVPVMLVGLLITGLSNALPEIYFAIASSRRRETQLIIGNLMGSVIFPATIVLGVVALIHPITTVNFEFALSSRIFLFIAAILFMIFSRSKGKIDLGEGSILFALYIAFVGFILF